MSDMDKNVNSDLQLNTDTGLTVEDNVGPEELDTMHVQQAETSVSASETELRGTCADEGDQSIPDVESMPSAVLQTNGEFMCSSCGEMMKCARAIKRHISAHMSLQSLEPSTTPYQVAGQKNDNVSKGKVMQKWPKKQASRYKRAPRPDSNKDSSKQWRSYVCKDCGDVFTSSPLLDLHRVQMHRPHKCQKCGMVLTGRRNFSQHVRKEHPGLHICKVGLPVLTF